MTPLTVVGILLSISLLLFLLYDRLRENPLFSWIAFIGILLGTFSLFLLPGNLSERNVLFYWMANIGMLTGFVLMLVEIVIRLVRDWKELRQKK
jgi:hypothetical protein